MRLKYGIAIAGSHGKTTTTSLVATVLRAAGLDPTVVDRRQAQRARLERALGTRRAAGRRGRRDRRLVPAPHADDRRDHQHRPRAPRPLRRPTRRSRTRSSSSRNRVPFYGLVVACLDHPHVQDILPRIEKRVATYGLAAQADYRARDLRSTGSSTRFDAACAAASRSGDFRCACPARTTCSTRSRRSRSPTSSASPSTIMREALADVRRRAAPLHRARRGDGRHRGRRLRPPPGRDRGHARGRAARVRAAHRGRVPAAPLHAARTTSSTTSTRAFNRRRRAAASPTSTPPARRRSPARTGRASSRRSARTATATSAYVKERARAGRGAARPRRARATW